MGSDKYTIVYQARDAQLSDGGVYTEYLLAPSASTSDLPTDCRYGSLAYKVTTGTLYMFDIGGSWEEVGA